jgi:uncharacterized membrane protein
VLFAALPVIRSRREEQLRGVQIALVLVNAFAFLGALDCLLWPDDRWALALALLVLSGLHLVAWRAIRSVPATFPTRLVYAGLALFGLAAGKVFLYDLSFLERTYRILSFLVLGIVLLVVSFFYQRRPAPGR